MMMIFYGCFNEFYIMLQCYLFLRIIFPNANHTFSNYPMKRDMLFASRTPISLLCDLCALSSINSFLSHILNFFCQIIALLPLLIIALPLGDFELLRGNFKRMPELGTLNNRRLCSLDQNLHPSGLLCRHVGLICLPLDGHVFQPSNAGRDRGG